MASPLRLEVFETPDLPEGPATLMPDEVEDLRLTAYERGYVAGWDDAGRQAEADDSARRARVAAGIEALTFGYHEARAEILTAFAPLLTAIAEALLPAMARAAVVPLVVEQLLPLAASQADRPLTLRVPVGLGPSYSAALEGLVLPPLQLVETSDLAEAQAEIVADSDETRIDLTAAATRIAAAIATFHSHPTQESRRA
jgi:hypothetical protein